MSTISVQEILGREGTSLDAASDRPLVLDGHRAWWVESGRIDLFSFPVEDGRATGGRTHLFRAGAGRLLVGTGDTGEKRRVRLLGIGIAGTRLRELSDVDLRALLAHPEAAGPMGELLDEWVDVLCEFMARGVTPEACRELDSGELALPQQACVRPRQRTAWVRHDAGNSLFLGREGLKVNGDGYVPLSRHAWMDVAGGSRLRTASTGELLGSGEEDMWSGMDRFHSLVLRCAEQMAEEAATAERGRLRQRTAASRWAFDDAFASLASTLETRDASRPRLRTRPPAASEEPAGADALFEVSRLVGEALDVPVKHPPGAMTAVANPLEAIARASRLRTRLVMLRDGWWRADGGPLVAFMAEDRRPVALLPAGGGYLLQDPVRRTEQRVTEETAESLAPQAYTFYRPFPDQPIGLGDLVRFGLRGCTRELLVVLLMGAAAGLLSLVTPIATGMIFNDIIPGAARPQLLHLTVILVVIAVSTSLFNLTSGMALLRIEGKMGSGIQAAVWNRLLALPMPFFRPYTAGDLAVRAMGIDAIRQILSGATTTALLSGIFSLFHLGLLFSYSSELAWWAVLLLAIAVGVSGGVSYIQLSHQRKVSEREAKLSGSVLQFLSSIAKLKVAGAEVHAFAIWARKFSEQRRLQFRARSTGNVQTAFGTAFPLLASLLIYVMAMPLLTVAKTLNTGDFLAFVTSFGICLSSLLSASTALLGTLAVVPLYEQARPILATRAEVDTAKADPGRLAGGIEAQHVSFRYQEDGPPVLRDVSFAIRPGEFVAFVGPSGSGKSTIFRLLLGFESPESGAIYFDGQDLSGLDLPEVRSQTGVVLQNGRLMPGDIFTNIIGSAPLTMDDAWEAARMAGLDADIKAMPMGMHTVVAEGGGTLSGGQRQRLMIARAIVRRPKVLLFDEATSALDNRTQAIVSDSLGRLQATRIVVAHRLSTIVSADRIFVVEAGRIVQTGSYQELVHQDGPFAELAKRQII
jgi:ATP-binding cassette subfamily C protein